MALKRTGYELEFREIVPGNPNLGSAALIPWDSETFGFAVGVYRPGSAELDAKTASELRSGLAGWADRNEVLLCAATVGASNRLWKRILPESGFLFVDAVVQANLRNLGRTQVPECRSTLRPAHSEDRPAIEEIAAAFDHGRYHADPLFPRALAHRRYLHWVARAWNDTGIDRLYVMGEPGEVQGVCHITVENGSADLRLASVTPDLRGTMFGFELYASMLHLLKQAGVTRVVTSISAANTAVLNVYSALGFHFSEPEVVYHWHASEFERRASP